MPLETGYDRRIASRIAPLLDRLGRRTDEQPEIEQLGHRQFIGGLWDEIGRLQFDFMVAQGLEPHHVLLDVACGSLRGGVHFIRYLDPGNYLGIDKSRHLVESGLREELGEEVAAERRPEIVITDRFEFERLSKRPEFAIAQSLFTHLTTRDIERCLGRLRRHVDDHCRFYATFFEVDQPTDNERRSHSRVCFYYTAEQMRDLAAATGWEARYIGDWSHPRNQKMMLFLPSRS